MRRPTWFLVTLYGGWSQNRVMFMQILPILRLR